MNPYRGVDVYIRVFLTSTLVGGEWLASRPCRFKPGKTVTCTQWIGGWIHSKAGLDDM
jgi:hypothetical protein